MLPKKIVDFVHKKVKKQYSGMRIQDTRRIIGWFFEAVIYYMLTETVVRIPGFGKFFLRHRKGGKFWNGFDKKFIYKEDSVIPTFHPAPKFLKLVQDNVDPDLPTFERKSSKSLSDENKLKLLEIMNTRDDEYRKNRDAEIAKILEEFNIEATRSEGQKLRISEKQKDYHARKQTIMSKQKN